MALARHQQRISGTKRIDTAQDRFGAVGDLGGLGTGGEDGGADAGGIFRAGVVVGDKDDVGVFRRRLAHQRTFAAVAVAARAKHHHKAAQHVRAQGAQGGDHGIGGVGVVDKDRGAVGAGGGQLHPAAHRGQAPQGGKHRLRIGVRGNRQPAGGQHVGGLKSADQRQARQMCCAFPRKAQILAAGVKALAKDAQIGRFVRADADHVLPPPARNRRHFDAARVVKVDDRRAILGQNPGKKPGLGGEIGGEALVVVQMILGEIGERRRLQPHPVKAALFQPVA